MVFKPVEITLQALVDHNTYESGTILWVSRARVCYVTWYVLLADSRPR